MFALVPLFSAILPILLWPVEMILAYPYIIEEIAKGALMYLLLAETLKTSTKVKIALLSGVLFTFSESVLYAFNIALVGDITTFFERLLITIPLHALTMLIILLPGLVKRHYVVFGVLITMVLHYAFNYLLGLR